MNIDTPLSSAADKTKERLAAGVRQMVEETDHLLKAAAGTADQKFDEARMQLEHQLRRMRLQLEELEDEAMHRARRTARRAGEAVQAHPYGAMGAAAAVGLLIGVLLSRR